MENFDYSKFAWSLRGKAKMLALSAKEISFCILALETTHGSCSKPAKLRQLLGLQALRHLLGWLLQAHGANELWGPWL